MGAAPLTEAPRTGKSAQETMEALKGAGNAEFGQKAWKTAKLAYRKALEVYAKLEPAEQAEMSQIAAQCHGNLAKCYANENDLVKSKEEALAALQLRPKYSKGLYRLAEACIGLGEFAEAEEHVRVCAEWETAECAAHLNEKLERARRGSRGGDLQGGVKVLKDFLDGKTSGREESLLFLQALKKNKTFKIVYKWDKKWGLAECLQKVLKKGDLIVSEKIWELLGLSVLAVEDKIAQNTIEEDKHFWGKEVLFDEGKLLEYPWKELQCIGENGWRDGSIVAGFCGELGSATCQFLLYLLKREDSRLIGLNGFAKMLGRLAKEQKKIGSQELENLQILMKECLQGLGSDEWEEFERVLLLALNLASKIQDDKKYKSKIETLFWENFNVIENIGSLASIGGVRFCRAMRCMVLGDRFIGEILFKKSGVVNALAEEAFNKNFFTAGAATEALGLGCQFTEVRSELLRRGLKAWVDLANSNAWETRLNGVMILGRLSLHNSIVRGEIFEKFNFAKGFLKASAIYDPDNKDWQKSASQWIELLSWISLEKQFKEQLKKYPQAIQIFIQGLSQDQILKARGSRWSWIQTSLNLLKSEKDEFQDEENPEIAHLNHEERQGLKKLARLVHKDPKLEKIDNNINFGDIELAEYFREIFVEKNGISRITKIVRQYDSYGLKVGAIKIISLAIEKFENRGSILQQGGLWFLLQLTKCTQFSSSINCILYQSVARLVLNVPVSSWLEHQAIQVVECLCFLLDDDYELRQYEGLLALTNISSFNSAVRLKIIFCQGWEKSREIIFQDNLLLKSGALELWCNLSQEEKIVEYFITRKNFSLDLDCLLAFCGEKHDLRMILAATGALAMLTGNDQFCKLLVEREKFGNIFIAWKCSVDCDMRLVVIFDNLRMNLESCLFVDKMAPLMDLDASEDVTVMEQLVSLRSILVRAANLRAA